MWYRRWRCLRCWNLVPRLARRQSGCFYRQWSCEVQLHYIRLGPTTVNCLLGSFLSKRVTCAHCGLNECRASQILSTFIEAPSGHVDGYPQYTHWLQEVLESRRPWFGVSARHASIVDLSPLMRKKCGGVVDGSVVEWNVSTCNMWARSIAANGS